MTNYVNLFKDMPTYRRKFEELNVVQSNEKCGLIL